MLHFLLSFALASFVTTSLGYLAAGLATFALGAANAPGFMLWRWGAERHVTVAQATGGVLAWLGQAYLSVSWAVLILSATRTLLHEIPWLTNWVWWIAGFVLAVLPSTDVLREIAQRNRYEEPDLNSLTVPATAVVTYVAFPLLALWPKLAIPVWAWVPFLKRSIVLAGQ